MLSILFHILKLFSYSLQNATEGLSQNVSSIWKAKDQRSSIMTWKPNLIFYFLAQIPMYVGCSGAAIIYASYITDRESIYVEKCLFLSLDLSKRDDKSA